MGVATKAPVTLENVPESMTAEPSISVVIPAHMAEDVLDQCLRGIARSTIAPQEVIVVNDGSTDGTARIAAEGGARLLTTRHRPCGPACARNLGARTAAGDILLFIDADVVVQPDTLARVRRHFVENSELAAVFGSYDSNPGESDFFSQYKNLQHHYVHQNARAEAETFWAGCGAIRKDRFVEVGGFDASRYLTPSVEDIELGYRLRACGYRIRADPAIQVCHLKRWTFWQLLYTDVFRRALPWSRLIVTRRQMPNDLNVRWHERACAVLAWCAVLALLSGSWVPWLAPMSLAFLSAILYLNRKFYGFLYDKHGLWFVVRAIPMHVLYFLYSSASFAWAWFACSFGRLIDRLAQ